MQTYLSTFQKHNLDTFEKTQLSNCGIITNKERAALRLPFPVDWRQLMCRTEAPDLTKHIGYFD